MIQKCANCEKEFFDQTIKCFCCNICEMSYWENPKKVIISTTCPQCLMTFSRTVYTIDVAPYQALTICSTCDANISL